MSTNIENILSGNTKAQQEFLLYLIKKRAANELQDKTLQEVQDHLNTHLITSEFEDNQNKRIKEMFETGHNLIDGKIDPRILTYQERIAIFDKTITQGKYIKNPYMPIGIIDKELDIFTTNIARILQKQIHAGGSISLVSKPNPLYVKYFMTLPHLNYNGRIATSVTYENTSNFCRIQKLNI